MPDRPVAYGAWRVMAAIVLGEVANGMGEACALAGVAAALRTRPWTAPYVAGATHLAFEAVGIAVLLWVVWRSRDVGASRPSVLVLVALVLLGGTASILSTWTSALSVSLVARTGVHQLADYSQTMIAMNLGWMGLRTTGWVTALILAFVRAR